MEFALLLPILTTMLLGTFQYGILIFSYNTMLNTARNGARAMAVGAATEAQVVETALLNLPGWVPEAEWSIVARDTATTGTNQVTTTITVESRFAALLTFVPMPETIDVNVVMLKET